MRQCREADTVCQIEGTGKEVESQGDTWPIRTRSQEKALFAKGDGEEGDYSSIPSHINTSPGHYGPWPDDGLVNMAK